MSTLLLSAVQTRFANDERVYKAFLEILNMYRKGQKTINNVYEEVSTVGWAQALARQATAAAAGAGQAGNSSSRRKRRRRPARQQQQQVQAAPALCAGCAHLRSVDSSMQVILPGDSSRAS